MNKSNGKHEDNIEDIFGPVIYAYTRAQTVEDGVLVDVSKTAAEAGIRFPTVVTAAVHDRYVAVPDELKEQQDETGRLWDLVWMLAHAIRSGKLDGNEGLFELLVAMPRGDVWQSNEKPDEAHLRLVTLKAVCGPSDDGSPCLTVMMPDED
jgi:hypothetical protein